MTNWRRSAAWSEYKAAFSAVEGARSVAEVEALRRDLAKAGPGLSRLFEGRPALMASLDAMMDDRLQARENVLQRAADDRQRRSRSPGLSRREAQPDLTKSTWLVSSSVAWVEHTEAALRELRAAAVDDPWIDGRLVPALSEGCDALAASAESLERLHPGRPEAEPLLTEARGVLTSARALLGEVRPGR